MDNILDPFTYVGRVKRNKKGKVISMEVFQDTDKIKLKDGDEFITFTTVISLDKKGK